MTEIALALAMGFFSLMVLTLISMGAGDAKATKTQTLNLATLAQSTSSSATDIERDDLILIFDGKRFLDTAMNRINPKIVIAAMPDPNTRVVLALDPTLSLEQALKARELVKAKNLVVSSLDKKWLKALSNKGRAQ